MRTPALSFVDCGPKTRSGVKTSVLREYVRYYHGRSHRGLNMQPPMGANWLPPSRPVPARAVRSKPVLGGLHNEYAIDLAA